MLSGFDASGRAVQLEMRPAAGESTRTWIIGRDKGRAQLVIDDSSVSGAHAEVTFTLGQALALRDLGSTNGTQVDGKAIGKDVVALTETGQEIVFGAAKLRLSRLIS
jgi:pSer/pThr/pTyr-binding forkhead associated (FHA) protein